MTGDQPQLLTRRSANELLERHGLAPRRSLGQNFLIDPNTVRRIVRLAEIDASDHVVEIGAGLGSLTLGLAATGARVTAIEVDAGLARAVGEVCATFDNVEVVVADALAVDWATLLDGPAVVVANLPYNVATPLVADLLDGQPDLTQLHVMVQREVAERLVAGPGDDAYGAVSVKVAYWAEARIVGTVSREVFMPRPNVESSMVRVDRRRRPAVEGEPDLLFDVVRTAFGHRRKMLRRSLRGLLTEDQIAGAGIDPSDRPETLGLADFAALAASVKELRR
ncbi:MAG TPA: 16S rRNA (adenine(1518)-N(6)/adenine(1519)-N(6))-dimethyltransferase RsmA [Acidimicrobiales bacterium]